MATRNGSQRPVGELDGPAREHRALARTAPAAVAAILWLIRPIGLGILVGVLLAFITQRSFEKLRARIGVRWAAITTVVASALVIAASVGALGSVLVAQGTILSAELVAGVGPRGFATHMLERASTLTSQVGVSYDELRRYFEELAGHAASGAARVAAAVASATASALLALFFAMLAMHVVLRNGEAISRRLVDTLPLRPAHTAALIDEFRRVGRATLLGSVVTGIAQGVFAAIGFAITGVPEPMFFGVLTAIASFVPAVGVLLVLVPVAAGLALAGHWIAAIVELAWGLVFVIGACDYIIRPHLVRGGAKVPSLVTFAALFGGVEVLGLQGILIGPVVMSLAIAVLRLYAGDGRPKIEITG
jgi:predicted PurR-regulated permease PerM